MEISSQKEISLPFCIKAEGSLFFICWTISLVLLSAAIFLGGNDWEAWKGRLACLAVVALVLSWVYSFKVILGANEITYKRLFHRASSLPYDSIREAKIETFMPFNRKPADTWKPTYSLRLITEQSADAFTINIKVFSRKRLSKMISILASKAPNARFDSRCKKMMKGKMPSVIFK